MVSFVIPGKCVAKERPRKSKEGHFYTPQKTKDYEALVGWTYKSKLGKKFDKDTPIMVDITINQKMPKNFTKKQITNVNAGLLKPMTQKDLDNQIKSILDGLNGVAYHDDKQVVEIRAKKIWSVQEFTVVSIGKVLG